MAIATRLTVIKIGLMTDEATSITGKLRRRGYWCSMASARVREMLGNHVSLFETSVWTNASLPVVKKLMGQAAHLARFELKPFPNVPPRKTKDAKNKINVNTVQTRIGRPKAARNR